MFTKDQLREKANRGAALLDKAKPDWFKNVNLDILNQTSASRCVVGQAFGNYTDGLRVLFGGSSTCAEDVSHGFDVQTEDAGLLNTIWKEIILEKRADFESVKSTNQSIPQIIIEPVVIEKYVNDWELKTLFMYNGNLFMRVNGPIGYNAVCLKDGNLHQIGVKVISVGTLQLK